MRLKLTFLLALLIFIAVFGTSYGGNIRLYYLDDYHQDAICEHDYDLETMNMLADYVEEMEYNN